MHVLYIEGNIGGRGIKCIDIFSSNWLVLICQICGHVSLSM